MKIKNETDITEYTDDVKPCTGMFVVSDDTGPLSLSATVLFCKVRGLVN